MNPEHINLVVGTLVTGAAALGAFWKATKVDRQIQPRNGDTESIRSMLAGLVHQTAELMHQVGSLSDRLERHDDRQHETGQRIQRIETVLNDHIRGN